MIGALITFADLALYEGSDFFVHFNKLESKVNAYCSNDLHYSSVDSIFLHYLNMACIPWHPRHLGRSRLRTGYRMRSGCYSNTRGRRVLVCGKGRKSIISLHIVFVDKVFLERSAMFL